MEAVKMIASTVSTVADSIWSEKLTQRWETFHGALITTGDKWLDHAAAVDLTSKTVANDATGTWRDEWSQFTTFGSWPEWEYYHQVMLNALEDGWQGIQSVMYWLWLSVQPILYSVVYLVWRVLQASLGAFLPYFQRGFIEICRFHLHLTWRQALGEAFLVGTIYYSWRIISYLRRQQYLRRTKRFIRGNWRKFKRSIQGTYREIAHVSLLLAMTIPHAAYVGLVVMLKAFYPTWVTNLSTETMAPSLIKFWYPIVASIVVLHHARGFSSDHNGVKGRGTLSSAKGKSVSQEIEEEKRRAKKKARRRRRSSIGALLHGTAPGEAGADDAMVYTEEEMNEDVKYWLNYWLLYSIMKATYSLATKIMFISTMVTNDTMHSILCQLDFLFYIWIFCLPECLLILFPSAGEEERRDWSKSKQWCYECSLSPVLAIPGLFLPLIVPLFESISQAVSPELWQKYVVDYVKQPLLLATMLKMLSEERKDSMLDHLVNFNPLVVPAVTLLMPGMVTQYGVWYTQFVVPQAHSYRALARERRSADRILYLKFWVLHGFATALIKWAHTVFWIVPLKTHLTFIVWCVLVMPRVVRSLYDEFDRELQAFHLLPPVADGLSVENTHTARALSIVYAALPKAEDVDKSVEAKQNDVTDAKDENKADTADGEGDTSGAASGKADIQTDGSNGATVTDAKPSNISMATKKDGSSTDEVEKDENPKLQAAKTAQDDGEKENLANNQMTNLSDEDSSKSSSSKSKQAKRDSAKKKKSTESGDNLRRRSNRLKQSTTAS